MIDVNWLSIDGINPVTESVAVTPPSCDKMALIREMTFCKRQMISSSNALTPPNGTLRVGMQIKREFNRSVTALIRDGIGPPTLVPCILTSEPTTARISETIFGTIPVFVAVIACNPNRLFSKLDSSLVTAGIAV